MNKRSVYGLLVSTLLLGASSARAAPTPSPVEIKATEKGLTFVANEAKRSLPKTFTMAGFSKQLINCPFTDNDTDLKASNISGSVSVGKVSLTPTDGGKLKVKLRAALKLKGQAKVTKPYACLGSTLRCQVDIDVSQVDGAGTFTASLVNGKVKLGSPDITMSNAKVSVDVSKCGFSGRVAKALISAFESLWVPAAERELAKWAKAELPKNLDPMLSDVTRLDGQLGFYRVVGTLHSIDADKQGLAVGASVKLTMPTRYSCNLPDKPAAPAVTTSPVYSFSGEQLGMALSRSVLWQAVAELWSGGMFCFPFSRLKDGLSDSVLAAGAALIGLDSVDSVVAKAPKAPELKLRPGSSGDAAVEMVLPDFLVVIKGKAGGKAQTITATADMTGLMDIGFDPKVSAAVIKTLKARIGEVKLTATDKSSLQLTPAKFITLVKTFALPAVKKTLIGQQIMPGVFQPTLPLARPYYVYVVRTTTTKDHVVLYSNMFGKPDKDNDAPDTSFKKQPGRVVARSARFVATGTDKTIPSQLLRFRWRVDGGKWSDISFGNEKSVTFTKAGVHTVEVYAIDLHGNIDRTPARATFAVDMVAPKLAVTSKPAGKLEQGEPATIRFSVSDDRSQPSQILVRQRIEHRARPSQDPRVVSDATLRAGSTESRLDRLPAGAYRVTLIARDVAGNESSTAVVKFEVLGAAGSTPSDIGELGGCTAGGGGQPSGLGLLLLLAALAAVIRYRRRGERTSDTV